MRFLKIIILLILLTACSTATPAVVNTAAQGITPTAEQAGMPTDPASTLSSLEQLDEYPFYVMRNVGKYAYPKISASMHGQSHFACALFVAMGSPAEMVYGRNFDWEYSPALLIFTDPPDGYASASMVDLTFLGIPAEEAAVLQNLQTTYQEALLSAPALPFDGMNEYGLAIGMAAVPEEYIDDASFDPSRPDIGSIGIIRQVLDHARNVEEALSIFKQFNVMFSGGPPIHYLIADPSGKAVLVEFFDGEMVVLPNESPWHLATNHLRCIAEGDGGCSRYQMLDEQLTASGGQLDTSAALQLLSDVKQGITQWSSVYNMNSGDISIVIGRDYDKVFSFRLDLINP